MQNELLDHVQLQIPIHLLESLSQTQAPAAENGLPPPSPPLPCSDAAPVAPVSKSPPPHNNESLELFEREMSRVGLVTSVSSDCTVGVKSPYFTIHDAGGSFLFSGKQVKRPTTTGPAAAANNGIFIEFRNRDEQLVFVAVLPAGTTGIMKLYTSDLSTHVGTIGMWYDELKLTISNSNAADNEGAAVLKEFSWNRNPASYAGTMVKNSEGQVIASVEAVLPPGVQTSFGDPNYDALFNNRNVKILLSLNEQSLTSPAEKGIFLGWAIFKVVKARLADIEKQGPQLCIVQIRFLFFVFFIVMILVIIILKTR